MSDDTPNPGRRAFLGAAGAAIGLAALADDADAIRIAPPRGAVFISTWPFGVGANDAALNALGGGATLLDACIAGVTVVERDPAVTSVGRGGFPNAAGRVQLDACVMDGPTAGCGAVAALEGIITAAAVAKRVMEKTRHILLVGDGARRFAVEQGFPIDELLTPRARRAWETWRRENPPGRAPGPAHPPLPWRTYHDTIGLLGLSPSGDMAGVCTTSGLAYKLPGRVGDSPLIGHGLFVDQDVGAAAATGVGEEVIRICGAHTVIEMMRAGKTPQRACEEACKRIVYTNRKRRGSVDVPPDAFIAVDKRGAVGAAAVHGRYFRYAVSRHGKTQLLDAPGVLPPLPT